MGIRIEKQYKNDKKGKCKYNLHQYYKACYSLMGKNYLNSIPVLEAQVAFIKNLVPIVLLYSVLLIPCTKIHIFINCLLLNPCCIAITGFVLAGAMLYAMVRIQDKIYELVWEGKRYLDEIEKHEKQ